MIDAASEGRAVPAEKSGATAARTPAERGAVVRPGGLAVVRLRDLRPGDVRLAQEGEQSVTLAIESIGAGMYRWTSLVLRPSRHGYHPPLPPLYWQFPFTVTVSGRALVDVDAERHVDPASLPPIPYPAEQDIPAAFTVGDVVTKGRITWERHPDGWYNQHRGPSTEPISDASIAELFRNPDTLRLGIPEYTPAAPAAPAATGPGALTLADDTVHLCPWHRGLDGSWMGAHRAEVVLCDPTGVLVPVCHEHAPLVTCP
ncbi:hypothetical protein ACFWXO_32105 [Kitasatospora sp. NPDC059088]|uniref:hypothetical protein n=1 Tax=Kitasatospora sp. NPDC059088 TaxID=3346722 RepID=UPI00368CAFCC